jgi:hypothetical protein
MKVKVGLLIGVSTLVSVAALVSAVAAASHLDLRKLAGVYKTRFPDALVTGEKYQGEDILEIVPISGSKAYIRVHIDAYNGHICDISGLARSENGALVLRGDADPPPCELTIAPEGQSLLLSDPNGACRMAYCGARGGFDGEKFDLSGRRPIRYMKRLVASRQYREALSGKSR